MNRTVIQNYKDPTTCSWPLLLSSVLLACFFLFLVLLSLLHLTIYFLNEVSLMLFNPYIDKTI